MKLLRADKALRKSVRNPASDPPRMFLEKLAELPSFRGCRLPRTGSAFYSERGSRTKEGSREAAPLTRALKLTSPSLETALEFFPTRLHPRQ